MSVLSVVPSSVAEVTFAAGLPGFPDDRRFRIEPWGPRDSPFSMMASQDHDDVGFVVVPPWVFHPDYEFDLPDSVATRLGLCDPADAVVLCVVTLGTRPEESTLNLLGPIVVHRVTGEAVQAVLDAGHDLHAPLTRS
jgi:flagellar assembly factor FliW